MSPQVLLGALEGIRAHLRGYDLSCALLTVEGATGGVSVQIAGYQRSPAQVAAALRAWSHSLSQVSSVEAYGVPGDQVHLRVQGRLGDAAQSWVSIYGAIPRTDASSIGADLAMGARKMLSLEALDTLQASSGCPSRGRCLR